MGYSIFDNLSLAAGVCVTVIDTNGETLYVSSASADVSDFIKLLRDVLDCDDADRIALLYGCYQSKRFGGKYVFFSPSGLVYCASMLTNPKGSAQFGVLAGPFLMTDRDEFIDIDVLGRYEISENAVGAIKSGLQTIPIKTPEQVRAISELLYACVSHHSGDHTPVQAVATQTDAMSKGYSIEKEDELLAAISLGDVHTANALLNNILGQVLFHSGGDMEILRSRVVELTVLLSRAALKGGASIDAIFGLNYSYLREIDALSTTEDIVLWLHGVTRRFAQHVFDYAGAKHVDVIYKAIAYIKQKYADKISVQDVADHVFLSPSYFSKVFKEATGQAPNGFISAVRIDESKKLLKDSSVGIINIPELIGFESQSYFTQVFKKSEGCTPGRFRKKFIRRDKDE